MCTPRLLNDHPSLATENLQHRKNEPNRIRSDQETRDVIVVVHAEVRKMYLAHMVKSGPR